jgi:hypothetical protein
MNPDVTDNITSSMSELQLQFLQHLKIQPLQTHLSAQEYQPVVPVAFETPQPGSATAEEFPQQWLAADVSLPLVQDLFCCLQQAGVSAQWFYQADVSDIRLTNTGLYSAEPLSFLTPARKKLLWQRLSELLPFDVAADAPINMDLT